MEENVFGYSGIFYSNISKKRDKPSYNQCVVVTSSCIWENGSKEKRCRPRIDAIGGDLYQIQICIIDFTESVLTLLFSYCA